MTHVVMTGTDVSMYTNPSASDTFSRFQFYAKMLDAIAPGSQLTFIATGAPAGSQPMHEDNLTVIPLRSVTGLYSALKQLPKIDVITTQTMFAEAWISYAYNYFNHAPVVVQEHTDPLAALNPAHGFAKRLAVKMRLWLSLKLLPYANGLRTVIPHASDVLKAKCGLQYPVTCLPVPISLQPQPRCEDAAHPIVMYAGRLAPEKNLMTLLSAAQQVLSSHNQASFVLVGEGPLRGEIEQRIEELGLKGRVHITGWVNQTSLAAHYAKASVFVLPSFYEGCPRVMVEAMAAGVPVVSSSTQGGQYLTGLDGAGLLRPAQDAQGMAADILQLLNSPEAREDLRAKGYKTAARLSREQISREWMLFLCQIANLNRD